MSGVGQQKHLSADEARRLRRARVRAALLSLPLAAAGAGAVALLASEDAPPERAPAVVASHAPHRSRAPLPEPHPLPQAPTLPAPARRAPSSPADLLAPADAPHQREDLVAWVSSQSLTPQVRYAALRRLEHDAPEAALDAALAALDAPDPLLRTNAVAVLARSTDPRAAAALESLDESHRRLARALARAER